MQNLKILVLQSDLVWEDINSNLSAFSRKINKSFDNHDLVILPETFTTGFPVNPSVYAEKEDGKTIKWLREMAKEYGTTICGSFLLERNAGFSNTLVWMSADGSYKTYDKRHVFSMGGEHEKIKAGNEKLIVELKGWKIKPLICYDLRFPIWVKNSWTKENGFEYDLAIFIANWPEVRKEPWRKLLMARAIENQAVVIGVNRVGTDGPGNFYSGNSMFVDAKGSILAEAENGVEDSMNVLLNAEELISFRSKFNVGPDWDKFKIL